MTGSLPQGQESLFWLNIKAIPSASKQMNSLQIAVKTRIKLIYRPEALRASTPEEQANKLTWRRAEIPFWLIIQRRTLSISMKLRWVIRNLTMSRM